MKKNPSPLVEIIPAILPKSFADLTEHLENMQGITRAVQIDMVDGLFARNVTWPYNDRELFEKIVAGNEGMPLWEKFDFEFDIMAEHPDRDVESFVRAGASRIVLHSASTGAKDAALALQSFRMMLDMPTSVGIALSPSDSPSTLDSFFGLYDFIQVMGISRVGFQGEPLDESVLILIEQLRQECPDFTIQVDGGVSLENVAKLVKAGGRRLIVGSAIFSADNPIQALKDLRAEANK